MDSILQIIIDYQTVEQLACEIIALASLLDAQGYDAAVYEENIDGMAIAVYDVDALGWI